MFPSLGSIAYRHVIRWHSTSRNVFSSTFEFIPSNLTRRSWVCSGGVQLVGVNDLSILSNSSSSFSPSSPPLPPPPPSYPPPPLFFIFIFFFFSHRREMEEELRKFGMKKHCYKLGSNRASERKKVRQSKFERGVRSESPSKR